MVGVLYGIWPPTILITSLAGLFYLMWDAWRTLRRLAYWQQVVENQSRERNDVESMFPEEKDAKLAKVAAEDYLASILVMIPVATFSAVVLAVFTDMF